MIAALFLAQVTPVVPPSSVPPAPAMLPVPTDVSVLPPLPLLRPWRSDPALSRFVRDETRARRCTAGQVTPTGYALDIDVAVLVAANGQVRRIIPRAIGCPAVEQYAAGLASRMVRGNVAGSGSDAWFRLPIAFRWQA